MKKNANQKPKISFDDIIREGAQVLPTKLVASANAGSGREKRRNQELAQRLLGTNRRSSAPAPLNRNRVAATGSFASRVGISKSTSTTPKPVFGNRPTPTTQGDASRALRGGRNHQIDRKNRVVQNALNGFGTAASRTQANPAKLLDSSKGISIRGRSGTVTIIAQNFAPGTTAADIEAVLAPEAEESGSHVVQAGQLKPNSHCRADFLSERRG